MAYPSFATITLGAAWLAVATGPILGAELPDAAPSTPLADQVDWTHGPARVSFDHRADIDLPAGFLFTDGPGTVSLLHAMGNFSTGTETGFLAPTSMVWFAIFRFSEEGYVQNLRQEALDPDAVLEVIRSKARWSNQKRHTMGYPLLTVVGWDQEPAYDPATHQLIWAVRAESEGRQIVNDNTRFLGRFGVMEARLVVDPEHWTPSREAFQELLQTFRFQPGQHYGDYRPGDRVAPYGLAALVTGTPVSASGPTGLLAGTLVALKASWHGIVLALMVAMVLVRRILRARRQARQFSHANDPK